MPIAATGIPAGATIVSIATLNVTISAATTGTGVALGATVTVTPSVTDGTVVWTWAFAAEMSGSTPITAGCFFLHEYGWLENGQPRGPNGQIYAESGAITLGEGDQRMAVTQLVFDATTSATDVLGYRFIVRENPADADSEYDTGLYTVMHNGLMDMRWSGRTVQMRMEAQFDGSFTVGRPRLVTKAAGQR
jgi:hypothetical protein